MHPVRKRFKSGAQSLPIDPGSPTLGHGQAPGPYNSPQTSPAPQNDEIPYFSQNLRDIVINSTTYQHFSMRTQSQVPAQSVISPPESPTVTHPQSRPSSTRAKAA